MLLRRRSTPLHAAGPVAGLSYCGALILACLLARGAVALSVVGLSVLVAAALAGAGRELGRALRWATVMGLLVCAINALVSEQGTTILWHFGDLPLIGPREITAQGVSTGALLGLRAITLVLGGLLVSVGVDPDRALALARRMSFASALTATVAIRLVPLLLGDAHRLAEAQRTRGGPAPSRRALLGASTQSVLDRALDVAATLEVRGFGLPGAGAGVPAWHSRQHRTFLIAAGLALVLSVSARLWGDAIWADLLAGGVLVVTALAFLDRRGVA